MTWAKWKLISVYLEIVLISTQDRFTVFVDRTIGSEVIWPHQIVHLGDVESSESSFQSVWR
jgi:hypothetical protein